LISEGININVTLLFAVEAYEKAAHAYLEGLTDYAAKGGDLSQRRQRGQLLCQPHRCGGRWLDRKEAQGPRPPMREVGSRFSAKLPSPMRSWHLWPSRRFTKAPPGKAVEPKGAQKQRLLWASTGGKNPAYRDTRYVEELIGPETVNTIPPGDLQRLPRSRQGAREPDSKTSRVHRPR
jgi:transaldolase/glucose-6-phosphate isomerase